MSFFTKMMTHGGKFHADDVVCVAMGRIINPELKICRVFNVPDDISDDTIVVDVGGGKYDHHQPDAAVRKDGHKRAACGLFFEDYWWELFPTKESAELFERDFIIPIEDQDNGISQNPLSVAISAFNPTWDSKKSMDECFEDAVAFMVAIIEKQIAHALASSRATAIVEEAYQTSDDKRIVIMSCSAPWQAVLCSKKEPLFVIFPAIRGGYNLRAVPLENESFEMKHPLPEEWIKEKPKGCTFVHTNLFLAAFDTEEDAVRAAKTIL